MRALVVLGGDALGSDTWLTGLARHSDVVIAADSGAAHLDRAGRRPDLIVGDLDSLDDAARRELERHGVAFDVHPDEKGQTDGEIAITAAVRRGADEIAVVGAFGGVRLDHATANVLLLAHADFAAIDIALVTERATFRVLVGPGILELEGAPGDWVSLEPFSESVASVTTDGLRYPLHHETLARGSTRGVSNELTEPRGSVEIGRGLLLIAIIARRSVASR